MGQICYAETSVPNYQSTLCNNPEDGTSYLHCDRSLKSRIFEGIPFIKAFVFTFFPEDQLSHRKASLKKSIHPTQQSDHPQTEMSIEVTVVGLNEYSCNLTHVYS
jgi:hypothetical protein